MPAQAGTDSAACKAGWHSNDGTEAGAVSMSATSAYGLVSAFGGATANCSEVCNMYSVAGPAQAFFNDAVTLQNVPDSGAYFLIRIAMTGMVTDPNYVKPDLQVTILGDNTNSQCAITTPIGKCFAYIPVKPSGGTITFTVAIDESASAELSGSSGAISQGGHVRGGITELAVVNSRGKVLTNVIITTASGHLYPL